MDRTGIPANIKGYQYNSRNRKALYIPRRRMTHSYGLEGEHEHGEIGMTTWLHLSLAIEQSKVVRDALLSAFPEEELMIIKAFDGLSRF